jgi:plasmid stability protein
MAQTLININGDIRDAASLTVPSDRTFRGAWQFNGNAVEEDMAEARDIHRDALRAERSPRFDALDAEWFRAAETADTDAQASVAAQKQALRDVTADARIDAAKTPDELKALTLDALLA